MEVKIVFNLLQYHNMILERHQQRTMLSLHENHCKEEEKK